MSDPVDNGIQDNAMALCTRTSSLETLPHEIQRIIIDSLDSQPDLSHLSRTCRFFNDLIGPILFKNLILRIPLQKARLHSLESLIASPGKNLRFTTDVWIGPQPIIVQDYHETNPAPNSCLPDRWQDIRECSEVLNVMVRLLITKLPKDCIASFSWFHGCPLEAMTLEYLFRRQGAKLADLRLTGETMDSNESIVVRPGLTRLYLPDMAHDELASKCLTISWGTIRFLRLGFEAGVVNTYAEHGAISHPTWIAEAATLTHTFTETLKNDLQKAQIDPQFLLKLERVSLCGLDLNDLIESQLEARLDLTALSRIQLESCRGLSQALGQLISSGQLASTVNRLCGLKSFFLRQEGSDRTLGDRLETFLGSFTGFKHIHLLLEGSCVWRPLAQALKAHNKSLVTLVLDIRTGPRTLANADLSYMPMPLSQLKGLAMNCPRLTGLGLTLNWTSIFANEACTLFELSKFPKLKTLNIRNMPEVERVRSWLPTEDMHSALASSILQKWPFTSRPKLELLAIGAKSLEDVTFGRDQGLPNDFQDFVKLRIYKLMHGRQADGTILTCPKLVAKGTPEDEAALHAPTSVFKLAWLNGPSPD